MSLQLALLIVAAASYLAVGLAVFVVFVPRGPASVGLWTLRVVVVLAGLFACWAIVSAPDIPPLQGWLGLALLLASDGLFLWCVAVTRGRRRSLAFSGDVPDLLLREGPWAWTRHPFYSSYLLSYAAPLVATRSPLVGLALIAVWAVLFAAARDEERCFRRSPLAADYEAYARRVGCFVPRLRLPGRR